MNKKAQYIKAVIMAIVMIALCPLTMWADITPTQPSQGDGTEDSPYLISNAAELYWFAEKVNELYNEAQLEYAEIGDEDVFKYYGDIYGKLTADITVNDITINENGDLTKSADDQWTLMDFFYGTFDGNGHTISGLFYDNSGTRNVGFCGKNYGTIKNLGIINSYFCGYYYVGSICGYNDEKATISNCYSTGSVKGTDWVGGICGYNDDNSTISYCYSTGSVNGSYFVGGICGYNRNNSTISYSYSTGSVKGSYYVGGICGENSSSTISYCYSTGSVNASNIYAGGICGYNEDNSTISYCYSTGSVNASDSYAGGICGFKDEVDTEKYPDANPETVSNCYTNQSTGYGGGSEMSDDQFKSGEVAYILNNYNSSGTLAWFQTLGTDASPVLTSTGSNIVYMANDNACDYSYSREYSNTPGGTTLHEYNANGFCTKMSGETHYEPATLVDGTYQISNAGQLYWFVEQVNGGNADINVKLTADITVNAGTFGTDGTWSESGTPMSWTPMGYFSYSSGCFCNFAGTFDGDGHTISGLYYNNSETMYVGFFGVNAGTIKNLGIINSYFRGYGSVGGVCGYNKNGTISNCYSTGSVNSSNDCVGGFCGANEYNATISDSYSTCSVNGSGNIVGGFCGQNLHSSVISNCYSTGSVNGSASEVGGFCGINDESATISNCYSTGSANGYANVGGFCGYNASAISNCYSTGSVSGTYNVYGFCWLDILATFSNCYTNQSTGEEDAGEQKTDAQFKSGEVAYLLNGSVSGGTTWFQALGTDDYPHFTSTGSNTVYGVKDTYCDGSDKGYSYSNSNTLVATTYHEYNANGFCTKTSGETHYQPATLVDGYYQISNVGQLYWFAEQVKDGSTSINGKLTADITVNAGTFSAYGEWSESDYPMEWTPMGGDNDFAGTFDGDGHTISGLYYNNSETLYVGFCGDNYGTIKNLGIINSYFCGKNHVSGICGDNDGTISNCYFTGSVSASGYSVGGISGGNDGTISNCYSTGSVSAYGAESHYVGGICGKNEGTISNCYSTGSVDCQDGYGGICGFNYSTVSNCYTNQFTGNGDGSEMSDAQFKSGEVAYLLNGSVNGGTTWYQKLGTDDSPHFTSTGSNTVYYDYYNCETEKSYSNIKGSGYGHLDDDHNGICERCGTVLSRTEMFDISDGTAYTLTSSCTADILNYTRSFNGKWQALYVPFAIDVDAVSDDYDIDYIIGVRQEDTDKDGVIDYQCMDVASMPAGSQTKPNYPYVIRKKTAEDNAVMTFSGVTLQPAASKSISCNTTTNKYTVTGLYAETTAADMNGRYAMSTNGTLTLCDGTSALKPQRWSVAVESRGGAYAISSAKTMIIHVMGEDDDATGISTVSTADSDANCYNAAGQRVKSSAKGLVIKNGRKYFNK